MHHRSSRSIANASSANFGSCPVEVSVAVDTRVGGRISSKASALRSSANWHSARAMVAPAPRCIVHIDWAILVARSLSRIPSAVAVSQCGTRWCSANDSGRNGPLTTGLSASLVPSGASGWGRLGITSSSWRSCSLTSSCSSASNFSVPPIVAALVLERVGLGGLAPPAVLADLLRQAR